MRLILLDELPRERWRNDGGWTREIVRAPAGAPDFEWRLSVAEVESDGPFSRFDGCDRILVLLSGAGMHLRSAERTVTLAAPGEYLRFAGELPIEAALADGPTTDLNLIWHRDRCRVRMVQPITGSPETVGGGAGEVALAFSLATLTTRVGDAGEALAVGDESEIVFVITPVTPLA